MSKRIHDVVQTGNDVRKITEAIARVSIQREAEVALEISDLTYRGKQVPPGHARAVRGPRHSVRAASRDAHSGIG